EVLACQPHAIRSVVLFVELIGCVGKSLERRTTARAANKHSVPAVTNQPAQSPMLDIVKRNFAAPNFVAFGGERILQLPDALGGIKGQNPADHERVVSVHQ